MKIFVDTNIFIYYFEDNEDFSNKIDNFFKENKNLVTSTLVLKEICWYYEKRKEFGNLGRLMDNLFKTEIDFLTIEPKNILKASKLKMEEKTVELNDLINYVVMRDNNIKQIFSTDKHFDRLPGITRKF